MFRLVLTRIVAKTRLPLSSFRSIDTQYFRSVRKFSSETEENIPKSRISIGPIHQNEKSRRMAIEFRCKICEHKLRKTFTRQSYEQGVVIIRCDSCKNLHLIADNLGWFKDLTHDGKFKNIAEMLKAKGEIIHRVSEIHEEDQSGVDQNVSQLKDKSSLNS